MTSQDHKIDWIDPRTGWGYYDDNPTRPGRCVPALVVSMEDWDLLQSELMRPARSVPALTELFKRYPE